MNLFIKKDERIHFSFSKLNIVGDTGIDLIFCPAQEWRESELKYIPDSFIKILPLIGNETVCDFFVYREIEGYPKTFISKEYIGINGLFEITKDYTFKDKE